MWSIVFGVLFGELFGDLGQRVVGDWALWRYRPAAETLEPLLLLAVAMGAAHVVLGLGLGAVEAIRFRERRELFDKLGVLLVLGGCSASPAGPRASCRPAPWRRRWPQRWSGWFSSCRCTERSAWSRARSS